MHCILLAAALSLSPTIAHAWGGTAHAVIDRAAIDAIPDDGPVFLRRHADYIVASAALPIHGVAIPSHFPRSRRTPIMAGFASNSGF